MTCSCPTPARTIRDAEAGSNDMMRNMAEMMGR